MGGVVVVVVGAWEGVWEKKNKKCVGVWEKKNKKCGRSKQNNKFLIS